MCEVQLCEKIKLIDPTERHEVIITYQGGFAKDECGLTPVMNLYSPLFHLFPDYNIAMIYRLAFFRRLMIPERSKCIRHNFFYMVLRDYETWLCPEGLVFIDGCFGSNSDVIILRTEKTVPMVTQERRIMRPDLAVKRIVLYAQSQEGTIDAFVGNARSDWETLKKNEVEFIIRKYFKLYLDGTFNFSWRFIEEEERLPSVYIPFYLTTEQLNAVRKLST